MALIEHVWPWTQQPQGAVRVNPALGLRPEILWSAAAPSLIRPDALGDVIGLSGGVAEVGVVLSGAGTNGYGVTRAGGDTTARNAASFVAVCRRRINGVAYHGLVGLTGQSGANQGIYVSAYDVGNEAVIVKGGVAGMAGISELPLDVWMVVVASWRQSDGRSYIKARALNGGTATLSGTATDSNSMLGGNGTYCVGRVRGDLPSWPGDIALAFASFDWLPESLAADLLGNPWQLFAPIERRIWVPGEAPGGVPSITAVYAENITATSADYRVTLDYA